MGLSFHNLVLGTELRLSELAAKSFICCDIFPTQEGFFFPPGTVARTLQVTLCNSSQGTSYYLHSLFINEVLFKVTVLHSDTD